MLYLMNQHASFILLFYFDDYQLSERDLTQIFSKQKSNGVYMDLSNDVTSVSFSLPLFTELKFN